MLKLMKWAFALWSRVTKDHQVWLRENQMKVLRGEEYERRLRSVMNAVNRMRNGLVLRVFQGWVLFLQMETRNKQLLESFGRKLILRRQFRCLESWKFKVSCIVTST